MAPDKRIVVIDAQELIDKYRSIMAQERPLQPGACPYPGDPTIEDVLAFSSRFSIPAQAEAA